MAFDPPEPGPDEVQVRTLYSLISIGTETTILHQRYDPNTHFAKIFSFPQLKTGVQTVGEVVKAGANAAEFTTGDFVFMRTDISTLQTHRFFVARELPCLEPVFALT